MSLEDFVVKVVAQIALNVIVKLIEVFFKGEYADEVVHSIRERVRTWGYPKALRSAVGSLLNFRAPVAPLVPQMLASLGALYLCTFWSWRVGTIALDWFAPFAPFSVAAWATVVLEVVRYTLTFNAVLLASAFASRLVICLVRRQQFVVTRFLAIGASASLVYTWASMFLSMTPVGNSSVHTVNIPWSATVLVVIILSLIGTGIVMLKSRTLAWADKIADRFFARFETAPTANG